MEIEELKRKTTYQSFDDAWMDSKNSQSKKKLDCLNFEPEWLEILDIGCNTWYFSIKFIQWWAKFVVWIDTDKSEWAWISVIELAKERAKYYWVDSRTMFSIYSFFDSVLNEPEAFNAIVCLSTFHYFRDLQEEFFNKCHRILKDDWLIIREWWIPEKTEQYSRGVDSTPCHFPDIEDLKKMAKWFEIIYKWKSVDQKWDRIPRYVLHFKKI